MIKLDSQEEILQAERAALCALCSGTPQGSVRARGIALLAGHRFLDAEHQLIFDALRELKAIGGPRLRELLPAQLNNKGFPDVELDEVFRPTALTPPEALALMRALNDTQQGESRQSAAGR